MIQNFRGKITKDTESAPDTIINSSEFSVNTRNKLTANADNTVITQQLNIETFDTFIEKKK